MTADRDVAAGFRSLVLKKHPDAYEDDDGDWVYIRIPKPVTDRCPTCGQQRTFRVTGLEPCLGSGGSLASAWRSAAEKLGLVWKTN